MMNTKNARDFNPGYSSDEGSDSSSGSFEPTQEEGDPTKSLPGYGPIPKETVQQQEGQLKHLQLDAMVTFNHFRASEIHYQAYVDG